MRLFNDFYVIQYVTKKYDCRYLRFMENELLVFDYWSQVTEQHWFHRSTTTILHWGL